MKKYPYYKIILKKIYKKEFLFAAFILTLLTIGFFYDIVFLNRTFSTPTATAGVMGNDPPLGYPEKRAAIDKYILDAGAHAWQSEPLTEKVHTIYKSGNAPLWNTNSGLGMPLAADMVSATYSPLHLPVFINPTPLTWDIYFLLRFFLAGFFTYLFARQIKLSRTSSFAASIIFMFSGHFVFYNNINWLEIQILIPFLLFSFERLLQKANLNSLILAGLAVTLSIFGGMPEATFLSFFFTASYIVFRLIVNFLSEKSFFHFIKLGSLCLLATLIGILLSSIQLLPFFEFLQLSKNLHPQTANIGLGHDQLKFLFSLFFPFLRGAPWQSLLEGGPSGVRNYIGITVLILAFLSFFLRNYYKITFFFIVMLFFGVAKTYGLPIINWVGLLPGFNVTDFARLFSPEISLSFAILAAVTLEEIIIKKTLKFKFVWPTIVVIIIVISYFAYLNSDIIIDARFLSHTFRHLGFGVGVFALNLTALFFLIKKTRFNKYLPFFLIGLMLIELFIYLPRKGRALRFDQFTPSPPFVNFLQSQEKPFRIFGLDTLMYPNTSSAFNIDDIRALNAMYVSRYFTFIKDFLNPSIVDRYTGSTVTESNENLPTKIANNDFFNLLNVKYILAKEGIWQAYDHSFIDEILKQNTPSAMLRLDGFTINGESKPVLFQHPPNEIKYSLTPNQEKSILSFYLALDPKTWTNDKGDGVLFEILEQSNNGKATTLFAKWIDPKNNPLDRKWHEASLNLSQFIGQNLTLIFRTSFGQTNAWDLAGWGDLTISDRPFPNAQIGKNQFKLVYNKEIKIYENQKIYPRAFVINQIRLAKTPAEALSTMKNRDFNLRKEVVIEESERDKIPKQLLLNQQIDENQTNAIITQYQPDRVKVEVKTEKPGVLVLSDIFYPGWQVLVDGKKEKIYPADYALRGVVIKPGKHEVEFKYSPLSFKIGASLSFTIAGLMFLFIIMKNFFPIKKKLIKDHQ